MTEYIRYCKHCGTRYNYCASGYKCLTAFNNELYCPECMEIMLKSLINIPKKFEMRFKYIEPDKNLIDKLEDIKKRHKEKDEKSLLPRAKRAFARTYGGKYDINVFEHYYDERGHHYIVEYDDRDKSTIKYSASYLYDLINDKFTDELYIDSSSDCYDCYTYPHEEETIKERNLPNFEPISIMPWMDFYTDKKS